MANDGRRRAARARVAVVAAAVLLAACATPGPGGPGIGAPGQKPAPVPPRLAGSSWYWLGTTTPAGLVAPADPAAFNLEFLDGGQLAAQLDCNTGGATWKQSGTALTFGPLQSTRKGCPGASEAERFARQLGQVRAAQLTQGLLELSLAEAGTMTFARDPDWRLRSFDCPNGVPPVVAVFGRDAAIVRWRNESWQMRQQQTASGVRYASGNAILFNRGNEASLVNEGRQIAGPCVARR